MKIKYIVDAASDMQASENLSVIPCSITMGGVEYLDGVNITFDEFYHKLTKEKLNPKTSQPSPNLFVEKFEELLDDESYIFYLSVSSKLSGTYNSACIARDMVDSPRIFVLDTRCATAGIRLFLEETRKLEKTCSTPEELYNEAIKLRDKVSVVGVVDTLDYLARGGRLSKAKAIVGNLLNIKPALSLEDGLIELKDKFIGKKRSYKGIVRAMLDDCDLNGPIYILYSCTKDNAYELLSELKKVKDIEYPLYEVGPSIGSHLGPHVYGVCYLKKDK